MLTFFKKQGNFFIFLFVSHLYSFDLIVLCDPYKNIHYPCVEYLQSLIAYNHLPIS